MTPSFPRAFPRSFRRGPRPAAESGFSMIEVLVALVVLAIGLLSFALLQTMSLRYTQSANHRTHAVNLAYDLIDQMRANRYPAPWYIAASFEPGDITASKCSAAAQPTGTLTVARSVERWQCQVFNTLGEGASASVTYDDGEVTVGLAWDDERWQDEDTAVSASDLRSAFTLSTRL